MCLLEGGNQVTGGRMNKRRAEESVEEEREEKDRARIHKAHANTNANAIACRTRGEIELPGESLSLFCVQETLQNPAIFETEL